MATSKKFVHLTPLCCKGQKIGLPDKDGIDRSTFGKESDMVGAEAAQIRVDGDDPWSNEVRTNPANPAVELPLDEEFLLAIAMLL